MKAKVKQEPIFVLNLSRYEAEVVSNAIRLGAGSTALVSKGEIANQAADLLQGLLAES